MSSVSGASFSNYIVNQATNIQQENISLQFAMAILKQQQDVQEMQAQAIIEMIQRSPSPQGVGSNVDVYA